MSKKDAKRLGSPPKGFDKEERARWRAYRDSIPRLRREHREIVRVLVKTVVEYERVMARIARKIKKGVTSRELMALQRQAVMLSNLLKDHHGQLIKLTEKRNPRGRPPKVKVPTNGSVNLRNGHDTGPVDPVAEKIKTKYSHYFDAHQEQ